jgi:hypothetical protein
MALEEISRRGIDPALMEWLRSGGTAEFPDSAVLAYGYPPPPGYIRYFNRSYKMPGK